MTGYRLATVASGVSTVASRDEWIDEARCAEIGTDLFFPDAGDRQLTVQRSICGQCPVRQQCLEWALKIEAGETYSYGVYGGLSAHERRAIIVNGRKAEREKAA